MTQKTSTKKVTKNIERPKPIRGNREVIRHFDPSTNAAARYSNLNDNLPFVNVDPSEEHKSIKPIKTVKISRATTRTFNQNNNKARFNLNIKSSSSSSLETKLEKFKSKSPRGGQPKSKSFHLGPTHTKHNQNVVSSARERQLPAKPKNNTHLRSSTAPALIEKELNVKVLKQEILDNKREKSPRVYHPEAWGPTRIDPQVEDLKSEILQSKTNNILNKKIFITELKSEVARYKHYGGNFLVYNVEEDAKKKQENNKQHLALLYQNQHLQPNLRPRSDKSNSSASTDKQEEYSGSSSTTGKEICKPAFVSRDQSDTESLDDEALKNKIEEANQLINQVKKALGKIKAVKNSGGRSSSTDIEETINKLKAESVRLITGNENAKCDESPTQPEEPRKELVQNIIKSDIPSFSKQVPREVLISSLGACLTQPKEPKKDLEQNLIKDDIPCSSKQLPGEDPISSSEGPSRKSSEELQIGYDIRKVSDKPENERPKTRRNETEDELSEQLRWDKFRNRLEMGNLVISSSFEELQEKLQTISETTESSFSTPRKKSIDPVTEQNCKGCNTTPLIEHKEIQVKPYVANVGVGCCCLTKEKNVHATPQKILTMEAAAASSLSPKSRSLDSTNLPVQEIKPIGKRDNYTIERLPTIETVVPSTEKALTMENIGAVSLPTKVQNKRLTLQHLPDIIIEPGLTLTPVLNLSISHVGESKNYIQNTDNCQYLEIVHQFPNDEETGVSSRTFVEFTGRAGKESTVNPVLSKKSLDKASKSMSKLIKSQKDKWPALIKSHRFTQNEAEEFLRDFELSMDSDKKLTAQEEEDMQQKLLYYKSYHIYDNPNKHNPGDLTAKSISKFSQMDIDVYKTFINPNPNTADEEQFASSPRNLRKTKYSFESKMVQCSEVITPEAVPIERNATEEIELRSEFSKVDKATSMLKILSEEGIKEVHLNENYDLHEASSLLPAPQGLLSETVLNVNEKSEDFIKSITTDKNSSLSAITLTISYTLSSDSSHSSNPITDRENSESEMIVTAANSKTTDITKTFCVADKDVISRLQNKLKCIHTEDSNPTFRMDKTSENCETLDNFLKGLTNFEERKESLRGSRDESKSRYEQRREDRQSKDEHHKHKEVKREERKNMRDRSIANEDDQITKNGKHKDKHQEDPESGASQEPLTDIKPKNNPTVNYLIQQKMLEDPYKHLELGKNGRYKDEENLFTNIHYPNEKFIKWPVYSKDICDAKPTLGQRDKQVALDRFRSIPRDRFKRHSPDTSNSETVTTNSVSEGEILCRHSISNGEIHVCRPRLPAIPRFRLSKSSIEKRHLSYTPKYRCPRSHFHKVSPRRFDLNDPTVSIEQRRNYFNNWVTYYVQSQGARKKSTPNCYNKQE